MTKLQPLSMLGVQPYDTNSSTLILHLGKAGGGFVHDFLSQNRIHFDQVHVHPISEAAISPARRRSIVALVRDPVSRFVSTFNAHQLYQTGCWTSADEALQMHINMTHIRQALSMSTRAIVMLLRPLYSRHGNLTGWSTAIAWAMLT